MQNAVIYGNGAAGDSLSVLSGALSPRLTAAVLTYLDRNPSAEANLNEIRLRRGRAVSLTVNSANVRLDAICTPADFDAALSSFCGGSIYAHSDTISNGYINPGNGLRVGVCGRAVAESGGVSGVYDITALNIRIPRSVPGTGAYLAGLAREWFGRGGILIYSPPGIGKTTLLRAAAAELSGGADALRGVIVDTRDELGFGLSGRNLMLDILSGYPRGLGIEIATRTLSAEFIVCDEIGSIGEAEAILAAQNSGVPLIASAHADSYERLMLRPGIKILDEASVFAAYVGISRKTTPVRLDRISQSSGGIHEFHYEVNYK